MATIELILDCADPERIGEFWAAALGYREVGGVGAYRLLVPAAEGDGGPPLILQRVPEPKTAKNRVHFDVVTDDVEAEADRLVGLGARRLRDAPIEEHGSRWVVLADPEGNEFCVCQRH